jgi:hypothetical protein
MEISGSGYLYTLATLAMTFVGFCAIVLVFRQGMRAESGKRHRHHSHLYIELGFSAAAFAMLAPLLAACGIAHPVAWRVSSAIIAVALVAHNVLQLRRFKASNPGRLPKRVWVNSIITGLVTLGLLANTSGFLMEPGLGPVAIAATWRLAMGVEIFLLTMEEFIAEINAT